MLILLLDCLNNFCCLFRPFPREHPLFPIRLVCCLMENCHDYDARCRPLFLMMMLLVLAAAASTAAAPAATAAAAASILYSIIVCVRSFLSFSSFRCCAVCTLCLCIVRYAIYTHHIRPHRFSGLVRTAVRFRSVCTTIYCISSYIYTNRIIIIFQLFFVLSLLLVLPIAFSPIPIRLLPQFSSSPFFCSVLSFVSFSSFFFAFRFACCVRKQFSVGRR